MNARVAVVISNKADAYALERAKQFGVKAIALPQQKGEAREAYEARIVEILNAHQVNLVVLAGFMRILSPYLVGQFKNRILNIHPSLLPAFPGLNAQEQAIQAGATESGCTVHLVDEGCDTGPIVLQSRVQVLPNDTAHTLSERILSEEHRLLPKAVDLFAKNKVTIQGRNVVVKK